MSMFDNFKIDIDILPISKKHKIILRSSSLQRSYNNQINKILLFQTKDFDNVLTTYIIDPNKILWEKHYDLVSVSLEDRPHAHRGGIWEIVGSIREENTVYNKTNYTINVNFYTTAKSLMLDNVIDFWYEFKAIIINGKLRNIEIIEIPEIPDVIEQELLDLFDIKTD